MIKNRLIRGGLAALAAVILLACGPGKIPLIYRIDTPTHHVSTGNKLLEIYKIDSAFREFNLAIETDPKYSPAYIGLGLTYAFKKDFVKGLEALAQADRLARGKAQEIDAMVGYMRFYTIGGENYQPGWLDKVETAFQSAILMEDGSSTPYYYMGLAYKAAGQFDQAAKNFYRVIEIGKGYVVEADREYAAIEKQK